MVLFISHTLRKSRGIANCWLCALPTADKMCKPRTEFSPCFQLGGIHCTQYVAQKYFNTVEGVVQRKKEGKKTFFLKNKKEGMKERKTKRKKDLKKEREAGSGNLGDIGSFAANLQGETDKHMQGRPRLSRQMKKESPLSLYLPLPIHSLVPGERSVGGVHE